MLVIRAVFRSMFRMVAKLNPYASVIPARVYSLVSANGSKPAFAKRPDFGYRSHIMCFDVLHIVNNSNLLYCLFSRIR